MVRLLLCSLAYHHSRNCRKNTETDKLDAKNTPTVADNFLLNFLQIACQLENIKNVLTLICMFVLHALVSKRSFQKSRPIVFILAHLIQYFISPPPFSFLNFLSPFFYKWITDFLFLCCFKYYEHDLIATFYKIHAEIPVI